MLSPLKIKSIPGRKTLTLLWFLIFMSFSLRSMAKMEFVSYRDLIIGHRCIVYGQVLLPSDSVGSTIYRLRVIRVLKGVIRSDTVSVLGVK